MGTIQPLTREELAQIRQWYADKARDLPRKVVRDVAALLDHIACQGDVRRAALYDALAIAQRTGTNETIEDVRGLIETAACSCTITRHERQENRACPVRFPARAT